MRGNLTCSEQSQDAAVLITGAGGFIGRHAVSEFVRRGWFVYAMVHQHTPPQLRDLQSRGKVNIVTGDIRCLESMQTVFEATDAHRPLRAVIHCAGRASDIGWARDFRQTNYESVKHLTALCQEYAARVVEWMDRLLEAGTLPCARLVVEQA